MILDKEPETCQACGEPYIAPVVEGMVLNAWVHECCPQCVADAVAAESKSLVNAYKRGVVDALVAILEEPEAAMTFLLPQIADESRTINGGE